MGHSPLGASARRSGPPLGLLLAVVVLVLGCASEGGQRKGCTLRQGMTEGDLVRCGCIRANSGSGSVIVEGGRGGEPLTLSTAQYICVYPDGRVDRVVVVNGEAQRVLR